EGVVVLVPAERHRRLQTSVLLLQLEVILDRACEQGLGLGRHIALLLRSVAGASAPDCRALSTERLRRSDRPGGALDPIPAVPLRLVEGAVAAEDALVRRGGLREGADAEARGGGNRRAVGAGENTVAERRH